MKFTKLATAVSFVLCVLGQFAEAQTVPVPEISGPGRPDPTGKGRYQQFGTEMSFPGATVVRRLPEGATCAPAGELVGVPIWNSTRRDHAIASVLTDKAEVATSGNRTFLCWCVAGFNELFFPERPAETVMNPVIQEAVAKALGETRDVNVRVHILGGMDLRIIPPPPSAFEPPPAPPTVIKKGHTKRNVLIGIGVGAVATFAGVKVFGNNTPKTRVPNPKVYTNPTGFQWSISFGS